MLDLYAGRRRFAYDDVRAHALPGRPMRGMAPSRLSQLGIDRRAIRHRTRSRSRRSALRVGYRSKAMLWDAAAINGYAIEAIDGRLGTVSDLLFEDAGWIIRWLVVDTGHWLPGRKVLLPLSVLGRPDRALRHFPIKLTMQQVMDSPNVDTDLPVSRQIEAQVHDYFGWNPYWSGSFVPMSNAMAAPFVAPLYEPGSNTHDPARADAQPNEDDPHLRSITTVTGYHIHATDGEIGHVEDFFVDDAGWSIRYIKVDTRN
jgi:hypothetical protein